MKIFIFFLVAFQFLSLIVTPHLTGNWLGVDVVASAAVLVFLAVGLWWLT